MRTNFSNHVSVRLKNPLLVMGHYSRNQLTFGSKNAIDSWFNSFKRIPRRMVMVSIPGDIMFAEVRDEKCRFKQPNGLHLVGSR